MRLAVRLVPVLALAIATTSFGQVVGSDHDLSPAGTNDIPTLTEVCLPCHTPHNSDTAVTEAPLWNHALTVEAFTMYVPISGAPSDPDGASKLCLSCHDGVTAMDNYGGGPNTGVQMGGSKAVGTDLSDDHPIGLVYPSTGKYNPAGDFPGNGLRLPGGRVECQSCHDPHLTSFPPFLRMSNTNSALCTTCHTL